MTTCSRPRGFTLIEVLVALAIIGFGLLAVFGQMNQSAAAATRLRDKTLAEWVGLNRISEIRLSGEYPAVGTQSDEVEMADVRWRYEVRISETDGGYLRRADVSVSRADAPDRPIATVVGFIGQPVVAQGITSGFPRLSADGTVAGEDGGDGADTAPRGPPTNLPPAPPAPTPTPPANGAPAAAQ